MDSVVHRLLDLSFRVRFRSAAEQIADYSRPRDDSRVWLITASDHTGPHRTTSDRVRPYRPLPDHCVSNFIHIQCHDAPHHGRTGPCECSLPVDMITRI